MKKFKNISNTKIIQQTDYFCGPAVLALSFSMLGKKTNQEYLAKIMKTNEKDGTPIMDMVNMALQKKFFVYVNTKDTTFSEMEFFLKQGYPVIVNYIEKFGNEGHFSLVVKIKKESIVLYDPIFGKNISYDKKDFLSRWKSLYEKYKRGMIVISRKNFFTGDFLSPL